MSFQRNFGTKIYEIGSPFCAYVTAGGSCYINLKNAVAEAHIYSNKFMYKMSGHDICRPHDHASFSSCGYAREPWELRNVAYLHERKIQNLLHSK